MPKDFWSIEKKESKHLIMFHYLKVAGSIILLNKKIKFGWLEIEKEKAFECRVWWAWYVVLLVCQVDERKVENDEKCLIIDRN